MIILFFFWEIFITTQIDYFGQSAFMQISLGKTLEYTFLTILTEKDWCFIQFSTVMAVWLLLIFLLCLHN